MTVDHVRWEPWLPTLMGMAHENDDEVLSSLDLLLHHCVTFYKLYQFLILLVQFLSLHFTTTCLFLSYAHWSVNAHFFVSLSVFLVPTKHLSFTLDIFLSHEMVHLCKQPPFIRQIWINVLNINCTTIWDSNSNLKYISWRF